MLGCHDFCGHYEWTFHYVRRTFGQEALRALWAEAIGGESQRHYAEAALRAGLRGLYETWTKTGEDESCDWTFTLDEARNCLRWDMRRCPSKGFLIANDLNADEDYCDHCMGWTVPLLSAVGVEVWQHEHNHMGQCWGAMGLKNGPCDPPPVPCDIRDDAQWKTGYVERWLRDVKQPLLPDRGDACDPCQIVLDWFVPADRLTVVFAEPAAARLPGALLAGGGLLSDRAYACGGDFGLRPALVLIGHQDVDLPRVARTFLAAPEDRRPLLVHPYLPGRAAVDFTALGLPRPLPLLPLLIRTRQYTHEPGGPEPTPQSLLAALARALGRPFTIMD